MRSFMWLRRDSKEGLGQNWTSAVETVEIAVMAVLDNLLSVASTQVAFLLAILYKLASWSFKLFNSNIYKPCDISKHRSIPVVKHCAKEIFLIANVLSSY